MFVLEYVFAGCVPDVDVEFENLAVEQVPQLKKPNFVEVGPGKGGLGGYISVLCGCKDKLRTSLL